MLRAVSTLAGAVFCSGLLAALPQDRVRFTRQTWQTESGLPQNSVHAIAQTTDGYLWVGTEGGLARFDGLQFTTYDTQTTPALRSNTIRALAADRDGSLWIGTAEGVVRLLAGQFQAFTTAEGLPSKDVTALNRDSQGRLWAVTAEGVAQFAGNRFVARAAPHPEGGDTIALPGVVTVQLDDKTGRRWSGTSDGLYVTDGHGFTRVAGLPNQKIVTLFETRSGDIWVGTEAGAARLPGGDIQLASALPEAGGEVILSFFEDREGSVWMGSDAAGLTVLRTAKFQNYSHADGLPNELLRCVFSDRKDQLWIGTNGHGVLRFGEPVGLTTAQGLTSNVVLSLAEDAAGALLVGTPDGLNVVSNGRVVSTMTSGDGLPDDFIRSIYTDGDAVYLGTRRGLAILSDGKIRTVTTAAGLPSDLVGSMQRGPRGCLSISTRQGLACWQNGGVQREQEILRDIAITALYKDERGVLWIGTASEGLARWDGKRIDRFPATLGLPKAIFGLAGDRHGQLWITSPNGLLCVRLQEVEAFLRDPQQSVSIASYGTADGLSVNEFGGSGHPTVWRDRSGTLWFVTAKGLSSIGDKQATPNLVAPPVALQSIAVDDSTIASANLRDLGPGVSRLTFDYAGLSFVSPQKIRFRYRLEGFDRDWVDAGTRRTAYYTNLAPKAYRFTVAARNNDGIWSAPATLAAFHVKPFFYQTIWFYLLLAAVAFAVGYAAYRWRVRQVQVQFNAVLAERTRIAREIHDTLAQGFVAVSVQLELAARLLATSTEAAGQVLLQTRALVQESLADARRSIWDLRSETAAADLPTRLAATVREAVSQSGMEVQLNTSGAYRSLPPKIEDELLRIGREAAVNAVKHADATSLQVALIYHSKRAQMTISDNGHGFTVGPNVAGPKGHYGLRGMQERADAIGALLRVSSSQEQGTQVSVEVQLP